MLEGPECLKRFCAPTSRMVVTFVPPFEARYGSPFVPQTEKVSAYLRILRESLESNTDNYQRFNQLTCYVVLALMFLSGMRPLEVAWLTDQRIWLMQDGLEGLICAKSKPNKEYDEWRAVMIPSPLGILIRAYRSEAARILELIYDEGVPIGNVQEELNKTFFFFIVGQRRRIIRLSTQTLGRLLREGSKGELKISRFLWRLNSPRHLYSTTPHTGIKDRSR